MVVTCQDVWREISNYLENELDPTQRAAVEQHIRGCRQCAAVLNGTQNVIHLYGDERAVELPLGFSQRLRRRLEEAMPRPRGTALGWVLAFAGALLIFGAFEMGTSPALAQPEMRSEHAQPAERHLPADMLVVVSTDGKTFHTSKCTFIHDKETERVLTAREAVRQGYVPCVRCMREYLSGKLMPFHHHDEIELAGLP